MPEEHVQRRLAAIMAADVVGYSRLIEADEEGTRARLRGLRLELIDPRIAADRGRIVKSMGDGLLVEFPSAVDAVRNALSIQGAMRRRNSDIPEDIRIELRVGINVGDVIIEGDDIHGDGVNVAARLEGLCEPGKVYVSGTVYDQADGKLEASFEDLGEQTVKNIAKPVRVYRAGDRPDVDIGQELQSAAEPPIPDKPSVAVLPFDNLSDDPQQEYFSDGMAEDLITDISKISGLSVTARNSSFAFKGQAIDVKDIAKKLGVQHIVEGSVRKMGDRLRINAQLVDGADGRHIWAERYDGNMAEIFEFQDDIREQIVSALQVSLTPTDKALTERKPTDSVEAYDLFLKGRSNIYGATHEHTLEAIKCLEAAIEIDPNFANAYGYLSFCQFYGWFHMWPEFDDTLDRAYDLADRGVELDSTSAIAVMRLGFTQAWMRRFDQAISNFNKAASLAPNNAEVYATFGQMLNYWGNPEKALELIEKALSLETFAPPLWQFYAGTSHFLMHRYDKALTRFNRMAERAPKFAPAYFSLAWAYVELGRLDDARDAIMAALEINSQYTLKEVDRLYPYRIDEVRNRFLECMRKAGLPEG
ncbi:MAG: adenylate/guanylate cyclase domain-containing protein [Planctomycetota bacterium]|jgi:adenylate cyclase